MKHITLGLIVNPFAGIGGELGLKGSDHINESLPKQNKQYSNSRTEQALELLLSQKSFITIKTCPDQMGELVCKKLGFQMEVIPLKTNSNISSPLDTIEASKLLCGQCDILLFAGGDGTARDIYQAYDNKTPILGIPSGVKMQSGVFAYTPQDAGAIIKYIVEGRLYRCISADIMDLDEELLKENIVSPRYYGTAHVPEMPKFIQNAKSRPEINEEESLALIADKIKPILQSKGLHILGPGKTTYECLKQANLEGTLIGVDVIENGKLVIKDGNRKTILQYCQDKTVDSIIVGCIGSQGIILGRGNQQIPKEIIAKASKKSLLVVATPSKLNSLENKPFRVDTGDSQIDQSLKGYIKVINGLKSTSIYPIAS